MKKLIISIIAMVACALIPAAASAQLNTTQGGTGTTSPSGILYGDGTLHLKTVMIGNGCTFTTGTLSCSGGSGSGVATTSLTASYPVKVTSNSATINFSLLDMATTTATCSGTVSCSQFVVIGSSPITITGSGGGAGNVSTSTHETAGGIAYWTSNSATPALLGEVATSTLTPASPLTGSFTQIGSSGSLGCQTASGSQAGCLSSSDWTTFNNKLSADPFWVYANSAVSTTTQVGIYASTTIGNGSGSMLTIAGNTTIGANYIYGNSFGSGDYLIMNGAGGYQLENGNNGYGVKIGGDVNELTAGGEGHINLTWNDSAGLSLLSSGVLSLDSSTYQDGLGGLIAASSTWTNITATTEGYFGTASSSNYYTNLGTAAGSFLAVNPSGEVIATTTPSGGSGTVTSVATTYPVTGGPFTTSGTIALAFGTTTNNTWAGTQTFNYASSTAITASGTMFANNFYDTSLSGNTCVSESSSLIVGSTYCVTSVSATWPLASSGGTNPVISSATSSGSSAGVLSAADWTTFNGKQANLSLLAGTYSNGDVCTYASSGTLLNCNTALPTGTVTSVTASAPLFSSGGTTPNITWAGLATTTNLVSGQVLFATSASGVGGNTAFTFSNTGNTLLTFTNASSTLFSSYGPSYFGATATSSFGTAGTLGITTPAQSNVGIDVSGSYSNAVDGNTSAASSIGVAGDNTGTSGTETGVNGLASGSTSGTNIGVSGDARNATTNNWAFFDAQGNNSFTAGTTFMAQASTTMFSNSGNTYLTALTSGDCVQASTGGLLVSAAAACGTGTVTSVTATAPIFSTGGTTPVISWAGLATTTNLVAAQVLFASSASGVAGSTGLTYASTGSLLTATNASTTNFTAGSSNPFSVWANGEAVAHDLLTGNVGQVSPMRYLSFQLSTSTAWTASSSASSVYGDEAQVVMPFSGTMRTLACATNAGTLEIEATVNSNNEYYPASTTAGTYTYSNTFTKGQIMDVIGGAPASSPAIIPCTLGVVQSQ